MVHAGDEAGSAEATAESGNPLILRAQERIGSTLRGKWRLDALIGVGGMAAVYAATHRNGNRAAVKLLHPELSLDRQGRGRFLREGRVANSVGHDGAVKVLDDDASDDGLVFLVLELLEGENLEERSVRLGGRLPENEVLWVADQLLDILAAAHHRGIVHRDIKPDNLFLTCSGSVKVLDFGIAHLRELSTASTPTYGGRTMGTPAFMAPEQARGLWDEVDSRSDLFAVGATMFLLLSGHEVHEGRTQNEQMLSAMTIPAPPLASVVPGVADAVALVVDTALAFDKADRWPSAERMREAVRRAYLDRTGKPITMAPRPIVADAIANRMLGSSREMGARALAAPGVATENVEWMGSRPRRVAMAFAAGVAAIVAIGIAIVRPGSSSSAQDAAPSPPLPAVVAPLPAAPTTVGTAIDQPSSPQPLAVPTTDVRPASPPTGAPKLSYAHQPTAKADCSTPFVLDPLTHFKHWKLDCL
jgi:hypothetical protein